jgi:hypothetical protein
MNNGKSLALPAESTILAKLACVAMAGSGTIQIGIGEKKEEKAKGLLDRYVWGSYVRSAHGVNNLHTYENSRPVCLFAQGTS